MLPRATELDRLSPYLLIWHAFDHAAKTELFSTAVVTDHGTIVIDPIALGAIAEQELNGCGPIQSIIVTNVNHVRAAISFHQRYAAPIFAAVELSKELPSAQAVYHGTAIHNLRIIGLDGAAGGEIAIHDPRDRGSVIVGDALINFDPYGFAVLPKKYCLNQKEMIRCLHRLLDLKFQRLLFAHGILITTCAPERRCESWRRYKPRSTRTSHRSLPSRPHKCPNWRSPHPPACAAAIPRRSA